jgi:hypothetical protein
MKNQIVKKREQELSVSWLKRINNLLLVLATVGIFMTASSGCGSYVKITSPPIGSLEWTAPC